jgi:hypothetical protein
MTLTRFSLTFLLACIPALAGAALPSVQDANLAFRQGNNQAALEKVNSFLNANPKDAQGRFLKGLVLTEMNRHTDAIKIFTGLTEDYPELPEPYNNLAVLYAAQADYERAKHSLEMAIRTHPSYATAHENLGDIYAKMASQAYDKALQLDKSNTSALTKLALIRDLFSPTPKAQEPAKVAEAKPTGKPIKPGSGTTQAQVTKSAKETKEAVISKPLGIEPKAQVERVLRAWAEAWSARDVDAYLDFYSDAFQTPAGKDFAAWAEERRTRITRPQYIKVSIDRLRIDLKENTAQVNFSQRYESNTFRETSNKNITLTQEGDTWKIVQER